MPGGMRGAIELSQRETPNSWIYLYPKCNIIKQSQESSPWGKIPAEQSQESNPSRAQSKGEQSNKEKPHESNPWRAIPGETTQDGNPSSVIQGDLSLVEPVGAPGVPLGSSRGTPEP